MTTMRPPSIVDTGCRRSRSGSTHRKDGGELLLIVAFVAQAFCGWRR